MSDSRFQDKLLEEPFLGELPKINKEDWLNNMFEFVMGEFDKKEFTFLTQIRSIIKNDMSAKEKLKLIMPLFKDELKELNRASFQMELRELGGTSAWLTESKLLELKDRASLLWTISMNFSSTSEEVRRFFSRKQEKIDLVTRSFDRVHNRYKMEQQQFTIEKLTRENEQLKMKVEELTQKLEHSSKAASLTKFYANHSASIWEKGQDTHKSCLGNLEGEPLTPSFP